MSNVKISQLPASELPLNGGEELPLVQDGVTKKATAQDIADLASANITPAEHGGIEFNVDNELQTIYNTSVSDTLYSAKIRYQDGTFLDSLPASDWKALTIVQVLDKILFPLQLPVYTKPTISFSTTTSPLLVEVGSSVSPINLKGEGTKNDAGVYDSFKFYKSVNGGSATLLPSGTVTPTSSTPVPPDLATLPNQFGQPELNNPNYTYTSNYADTAYSGTNASGFPIPSSTNKSTTVTYSLTAQYEAGNALYKSDGNLDTRTAALRQTNAPQLGDNAFDAANTITFTGYFPVYYGKSTKSVPPTAAEIANAINAGGVSDITVSKLANIVNPDNTLAIPYENENIFKYIWFAHYEYNTEKTKWVQLDASNNPTSNAGNIGSGLFALPVTQVVSSQQNNWVNKSFKIYISTYKTTTYLTGSSVTTVTYQMKNS